MDKKYIRVSTYTHSKSVLAKVLTAKEWREHGIGDDKQDKYYEFDVTKLQEVKMDIVISNV